MSKLSSVTVGFLVKNGFRVSWKRCHRNFKRFWSLDQGRSYYLNLIFTFRKVAFKGIRNSVLSKNCFFLGCRCWMLITRCAVERVSGSFAFAIWNPCLRYGKAIYKPSRISESFSIFGSVRTKIESSSVRERLRGTSVSTSNRIGICLKLR